METWVPQPIPVYCIIIKYTLTTCLLTTIVKSYLPMQFLNWSFAYFQVPIKGVGPNKQVGWIFYVNFLKQVGPNKRVG